MQKILLLATFALLMGVLYPALTTDCSWVGWDSIQQCGAFSYNVSYVFSNTTIVTNIVNISNITPGHVNTLEVVGIFTLIIIVLLFAAEFAEMRILGVFASLVLLLLGVIITTDGIVYKVGTIYGGTDSSLRLGQYDTSIANLTMMNSTTYTYPNTTSTDAYAYLSTPYFNFGQTLGFILILLSMFLMLHYALGVGKYLRTGT